MTGCGIGADHLSFGKSFSGWQWVSMMLKSFGKSKVVAAAVEICNLCWWLCQNMYIRITLPFPTSFLPSPPSPLVFSFTSLNFLAVVD
jgi:hypothetical protein